MAIQLSVNGKSVSVNAEADTPLLWVIRDDIGLPGTKFGCGMALCGACTVHLDGAPVRSCSTPVSAAAGKKVTTIEAMAGDSVGKLVQAAWLQHDVPQCGYCQSGQIMSAVALLRDKPKPTNADIDHAMSGNICRCGTYPRIRAAIHSAASAAREGAGSLAPVFGGQGWGEGAMRGAAEHGHQSGHFNSVSTSLAARRPPCPP